jgi:hypothetical protein
VVCLAVMSQEDGVPLTMTDGPWEARCIL